MGRYSRWMLDSIARYGTLVGALLIVSAVGWHVLVTLLAIPMPAWEPRLVLDMEVVGIGLGALALIGHTRSSRATGAGSAADVRPRASVYITSGLLDVLLDFAADAEPGTVTIGLATTPSSSLDRSDRGLPAGIPVFTHFYMPDVAESTTAVFGVDLGTPAGHTQGRFVAHPQGPLAVTKRDDLHGLVFVAVPPWDRESVRAFDRSGRQYPIRIVDAIPPTESTPVH